MKSFSKCLFRTLASTALLVAGFLQSAQASPLTFLLDWSGASFGNTAEAHGFITFESTLLNSPSLPSGIGFALPNPAVLDLSVTVANASSGNGTFGLGDFEFIVWWTGGVALDLSTELVGQPTAGNPWGTPDTVSGDFNLFPPALIPPSSAPRGADFFTLGADGGAGAPLLLTSMRPSAVPEPAGMLLFGAGLAGMASLRRRASRQ